MKSPVAKSPLSSIIASGQDTSRSNKDGGENFFDMHVYIFYAGMVTKVL